MTSYAIALAFLILAVFTTQAVSQQQLLKPENKEITLTGTIKWIHGYGAPGYGEDPKHDERLTYLTLEVPVLVNVPCTPEKPEWAASDCAATKHFKLFFPDPLHETPVEQATKRLVGHQVVLRGKLHRADTAGEMTRIFMEVTGVSEKSPK